MAGTNKMGRLLAGLELKTVKQKTEAIVRETGEFATSTVKISQAFWPLTKMLSQEEDLTQEELSYTIDTIFNTLYEHPVTLTGQKLTQYLRQSNMLPNEKTTEGLIRFVVEQSILRSPVPVPEVVINEFWTFFHELFSEPELKGLLELNLDIVRLLLKSYEPLIVDAVNLIKETKRINQTKFTELITNISVLRSDLKIIRRQIKALRYIKPFFQTDPKDFATQAQIVAKMVREFGPFFIKMAQVAASNTNFLPDEISKELVVFQEDVAPMSATEVLDAFEESIGKSPHDVYFGFDTEKPIKSGSISSVYLAKKPVDVDGTETLIPVIVKVRRNRLDREFLMGKTTLGLAILSTQYWAPHSKLAPFLEAMQKQTDAFVEGFQKELDFEEEAAIQTRFANRARGESSWGVPDIYFVSNRIMEMEYIDNAVSISKFAALLPEKHKESTLRATASTFINTVLNHMFVHQEFHGDLHPGNVMVNEKGKLFYVDWGNCVDMRGKWKPVLEYLGGALGANVKLLAEALINISEDPEYNRTRRHEIEATLAETLKKRDIKPLSSNFPQQLMGEGVKGLHKRLQAVMHLMSNTQHLGVIIETEYLHLSRSLAALVGTYTKLYEDLPQYFMLLDLIKILLLFPFELLKVRMEVERFSFFWHFASKLPRPAFFKIGRTIRY